MMIPVGKNFLRRREAQTNHGKKANQEHSEQVNPAMVRPKHKPWETEGSEQREPQPHPGL